MGKSRKLIGAACWASYFVNNDDSGLDEAEKALADAWRDRELDPDEDVVDCGDPYFSWSYDLHTGSNFRGGDLIEYTTLSP